MFREARLKLTLYYLVIIMVISAVFSFAIYRGIVFELERGFRQAENRLHAAQELGINYKGKRADFLFLEDLTAAKRRVAMQLAIINAVILFFSAVASYLLAGQTLEPIQRSHEQQKRFIADASHELRTPITSLKTTTEVALRDKKLNLKEAEKALKSNLEDLINLEDLTEDLLDITRYQQTGFVSLDDCNIDQVVKNVYKKIEPLAKKKKVKVILKLKKAVVNAEQRSLEKLALILLDNAIKYSPKRGKVTVNVYQSRKCVYLKVQDTGLGISKKDLPHIFERFYRADQSRTKQKVDGFGLGLSLAQEIVRVNRGTIKISSQLNKGSTFIAKFPAR